MQVPNPFATIEVYHDSLFDRFMIKYFSQRMSQNLGGALPVVSVVDAPEPPYISSRCSDRLSPLNTVCAAAGLPFREGFEGFVELSKEMMRGRNSLGQQQTVAAVLESLLPPDGSTTFRRLFPFNKVTISGSGVCDSNFQGICI